LNFGIQKLQFFLSVVSLNWLSSITKKEEFVSAFAPGVGFGKLMTIKLGTNIFIKCNLQVLVH
jgi:hypothetical protein